jgi:predicted DNA binding CopG/RHH family protein
MPKKKTLPSFRSEDHEREFWSKRDSADYVDWANAKRVTFSNLQPSTRTLSLRLPESMLEELKLLANKRDVPYQSLLKIFLAERIAEELRSGTG